MKSLLAIDPGVRLSGWARFYCGQLEACGHDKNEEIARHMTRGMIVIERPQVYGGRSAKGDTQDLLDLSLSVGFFLGVAWERKIDARAVLPHSWKGSQPKEVTQARAERALTEAEREIIPRVAKRVAHNIYDAVALGLWQLGRLQERRDVA